MTDPVEPRRGPGRPARISRERIVAAAAASENLDTLTMRDLASRMEVSHGALYRWVRTRDELFDLISEVVVERVVAAVEGAGPGWRPTLAALGTALHHEFLALPGYATHLARPHTHNAHSMDRLRAVGIEAFRTAGVDASMADQSWYIFVTAVVGWSSFRENALDLGHGETRFDVFLDVLLRGLPAREP